MTEIRKDFHIKVLGRLIEHLGVQMYKHRDAALAELVANSWDAGAKNIWITLPEEGSYDLASSEILVEDDGCGMDEDEMQHKYLVIGRNRRADEGSGEFEGRKVMGRKGIGKLAGFGIASNMKIETWKSQKSIELTLKLQELKNNPLTESPDDLVKKLTGIIRNEKPSGTQEASSTGTRISLYILKQKTPLNADSLHISLARRFSRTVQGHMKIFINNVPLKPISIELHKNSPPLSAEMETAELADGNKVKFSYSFSDKPIPDENLKGWNIIVNGKTAQAPPFFFGIDSTGRSQHSSKYLIGTIEADFLDNGTDDESDIVATDRQEIDWEREETKYLKEWGAKLTQKLFNEIGERNADFSIDIISGDSTYKMRLEALDPVSKQQCQSFIASIGKIKVDNEEMPVKEKVLHMADQIIKAFEYRHFINVIDDIEQASENPENLEILLSHLEKWEILESRSILEIIRGRIRVIDKFFDMIVNKSPETANRTLGADNFHDLIAGFPWLLNPEWQVFMEEKSISKILKSKGQEDFPEEMANKRIDFLALQGDDTIAVIEIKRIGDVLPLAEVRKLQDYRDSLINAFGKKKIVAVLIFGGHHEISDSSWKMYQEAEDFHILEWHDIFTKNKAYYAHYREVLENHIAHPNFLLKQNEVKYTKKMMDKGSVHRTPADREDGLGPQDLTKSIS